MNGRQVTKLLTGAVTVFCAGWWGYQWNALWDPLTASGDNGWHLSADGNAVCIADASDVGDDLLCSRSDLLVDRYDPKFGLGMEAVKRLENDLGVLALDSEVDKDSWADATSSAKARDAQRIDLYDPSTWPRQVSSKGDVVPTKTIDPYDPSTWPISAEQVNESVWVEPIDIYDPETWPTATADDSGFGSESSEGVTMDVYDPFTWPGHNSPEATTGFTQAIDPYDPATWPET